MQICHFDSLKMVKGQCHMVGSHSTVSPPSYHHLDKRVTNHPDLRGTVPVLAPKAHF